LEKDSETDSKEGPPFSLSELRDFTINSLLYDPVTNSVLDYSNAVEDICKKVRDE